MKLGVVIGKSGCGSNLTIQNLNSPFSHTQNAGAKLEGGGGYGGCTNHPDWQGKFPIKLKWKSSP